jgi:hypothetical protein
MSTGLVKVPFEHLKSEMVISRRNIKVYEVLSASKDQVILMESDKKWVLFTREDYEADDWYTAVKRRTERKPRGKNKG